MLVFLKILYSTWLRHNPESESYSNSYNQSDVSIQECDESRNLRRIQIYTSDFLKFSGWSSIELVFLCSNRCITSHNIHNLSFLTFLPELTRLIATVTAYNSVLELNKYDIGLRKWTCRHVQHKSWFWNALQLLNILIKYKKFWKKKKKYITNNWRF